MSTYLSSQEISLRLKDMHFSGNITPAKWYRTIVNDKGKPNLNAITVLSEIVFLYRPYPERDEYGRIVGYRNKVKTEYLHVTYRQFEDKFGFSKDVTRASLDFLKGLKVIDKFVRTEEIEGVRVSNVLNIVLYPERIYELTFDDKVFEDALPSKEDKAIDECSGCCEIDGVYECSGEAVDDGQIADGNDSISYLEKSDELVEFSPPARGGNATGIDIYNNSHISRENYINHIDIQSSSGKGLDMVKERIGYHMLLREVDEDEKFLDLIVKVLFFAENLPDEGFCSLLGKDVTNAGVKDRLRSVKKDDVVGVYEGLCSANVRITDEFKYYLKCLYNEPVRHRFRKKKNSFGFSNQREYDYDALEKILLNSG